MDPDLFSPADTAALLAIRAVIAERTPSPAELRALFDATGLARQPNVRKGRAGAARSHQGAARLG